MVTFLSLFCPSAANLFIVLSSDRHQSKALFRAAGVIFFIKNRPAAETANPAYERPKWTKFSILINYGEWSVRNVLVLFFPQAAANAFDFET